MRTISKKWFFVTLVVTILLTTPIWLLVSFIFEPTNENWTHLAKTLLPEYITNSLILMFGVSIGTLLFGVYSAWLITQYQFFASNILHWALLLPLAIPAYIIAYTYTGLLEFEGPVQSYLRTIFSTQTVLQWFPEVRSLGGAILMFSLVLYPYVYLLARAAFASKSQQIIEVSKTLGASPLRIFFKVALPMARPAIIAGLTLALMETLADFGTVKHFGIPTFTTGIYRSWTGFGDTTTTAQLSLLLLAFVITLILIELWSRRQAKYFTHQKNQPPITTKITGLKAVIAFIICSLPILLGFIIPTSQLLAWSINSAQTSFNKEFFELIWNSFYLAFFTALITVIIALLLAYSKRIQDNKIIYTLVRITTFGYAIPGTVIAIAVMILFTTFDNYIDSFMLANFNISTGLILSGTLFILVFAYTFRFLSVSLQTIDSGLSRIKNSMDETAITLGARPTRILTKIHLPMLKTSLLTAFILVFVEVLKELPTTLILRPFNFNTLSVRAYEMAADERLADAGLPAILIVLTGLIPVIILSQIMRKQHA
jgi:iron(III) transport system permease protein